MKGTSKKSSLHGRRVFDEEYYHRFFDSYSKKEFELYRRWADGWFRFLDKYADLKDGQCKRVLELGASTGYFSRVLKDRGFDVHATDISSYIINKAKKLQKDIKFSVVDVEKKIDVKGKFDFIIAFEVLEHLENPEKALKNIRGKLKEDGVFIFSTPFPTKRSLADSTHINVHIEDWWLKAGKKAGFRKRKLIHATFIPYLYRFGSIFSWGFPAKTDISYINSTCFFIFEK